MAHFKILLDRSLSPALRACFPGKQVLTTESIGLPQQASDEEIIALASVKKYLLVAANRAHFIDKAQKYVATTSKKPNGCARVCGLILLVPNEKELQERALSGLEGRLTFEQEKITYNDVHDRDLIVHVESTGEIGRAHV